MIDNEDVFYLSYWRATQRTVNDVPFLDAFFNRFLASSPEVARRFNATNVDALKRMLSISIVHVAKYYSTGKPDALLKVLAARHSRGDLDISPDLYQHWLTALVDTVTVFDPRYEEQIGDAWRRVLEPGIAYMASRYDVPEAPTSDSA